MTQTEPPPTNIADDEDIDTGSDWPTEHQSTLADGRVQCDVCPRHCKLREGQRGLCFVRMNSGGNRGIVLTTYGRSSGFCIDPIEKKPLNHFYPGTSVLSFGTAGCNLQCKFCQNWSISKARAFDKLTDDAPPERVAQAAKALGCRSVAFTYNDPVIFMEYAIDIAHACRALGIKTVAVTAGYITEAAREPFFAAMDAANVDLKAFTEEFYRSITKSELEAVKETLVWLKRDGRVWFEITNLLIPGHNDDPDELDRLCGFVASELGRDVPLHFSAFHPDYKMLDVPHTPHATLTRARQIALRHGIRYVYVGNVHDPQREATWCHGCGAMLIGRDRYALSTWNLDETGSCRACGTAASGRFDAQPGAWGRRRVPVNLDSLTLPGI